MLVLIPVILFTHIYLDAIEDVAVMFCFGIECITCVEPGLGSTTRLGWTNIPVVASLIILHKPDIAPCPSYCTR